MNIADAIQTLLDLGQSKLSVMELRTRAGNSDGKEAVRQQIYDRTKEACCIVEGVLETTKIIVKDEITNAFNQLRDETTPDSKTFVIISPTSLFWTGSDWAENRGKAEVYHSRAGVQLPKTGSWFQEI